MCARGTLQRAMEQTPNAKARRGTAKRRAPVAGDKVPPHTASEKPVVRRPTDPVPQVAQSANSDDCAAPNSQSATVFEDVKAATRPAVARNVRRMRLPAEKPKCPSSIPTAVAASKSASGSGSAERSNERTKLPGHRKKRNTNEKTKSRPSVRLSKQSTASNRKTGKSQPKSKESNRPRREPVPPRTGKEGEHLKNLTLDRSRVQPQAELEPTRLCCSHEEVEEVPLWREKSVHAGPVVERYVPSRRPVSPSAEKMPAEQEVPQYPAYAFEVWKATTPAASNSNPAPAKPNNPSKEDHYCPSEYM